MEDYLTQYPEIDAVSIWNDGITVLSQPQLKMLKR